PQAPTRQGEPRPEAGQDQSDREPAKRESRGETVAPGADDEADDGEEGDEAEGGQQTEEERLSGALPARQRGHLALAEVVGDERGHQEDPTRVDRRDHPRAERV